MLALLLLLQGRIPEGFPVDFVLARAREYRDSRARMVAGWVIPAAYAGALCVYRRLCAVHYGRGSA